MKNAKISRRSFLLGLAACSAAGVLTACKGTDAPSGSTASSAAEPPASSAASSAVQQPEPFLTVEEFPPLDGSTACIPLMAQMLADTTGMDLEEARSSITVSTTAYAWENFGLYDTTTRMLVVYEAPDYVKKELQEANVQLEQKPIGVDALVFIVNEDNPVQALSQQQLRDIYAGKITNWKDVGGKDQAIVAFQRGEDSGSQTLFKKLLIQGGELMTPPSELAPAEMGELVDSIADYNNSANAIGFSVYYYIDQMYSKPGLRLLTVDGVTPSKTPLPTAATPCATISTLSSTRMPPPTARSAACTTGWTPTPGRTASKSPAMWPSARRPPSPSWIEIDRPSLVCYNKGRILSIFMQQNAERKVLLWNIPLTR